MSKFEISSAKSLQEQAAGLGIHFTWMGTSKSLTNEEKDKAAEPFGAQGEGLAVSKKLIDSKNIYYKPLTTLQSQIRTLWINYTLPWVEKGVRLIPRALIPSFRDQFAVLKEEFQDATETLGRNWNRVKESQRQKLGNLYCENDYAVDPTKLFSVEPSWPNLSPPEYLRTIDPALYQQEQEAAAARFEKAINLAVEGYGQKLLELVEGTAEKLRPNADGTHKKFASDLAGPFTEFLTNFRRMNITSNSELDQFIQQAEALFSSVNPAMIRLDSNTRTSTVKAFDDLSAVMQTKIVAKSRRKLILAEPAQQPEATVLPFRPRIAAGTATETGVEAPATDVVQAA